MLGYVLVGRCNMNSRSFEPRYHCQECVNLRLRHISALSSWRVLLPIFRTIPTTSHRHSAEERPSAESGSELSDSVVTVALVPLRMRSSAKPWSSVSPSWKRDSETSELALSQYAGSRIPLSS